MTTTPWYKRILTWIGLGAKAALQVIYEIVAPAVRSAALNWVNNPENQQAALAAVRAAATGNLKGREAWHHARSALLDILGEAAWHISDNWLDTLLQSAYFAYKNSQSPDTPA